MNRPIPRSRERLDGRLQTYAQLQVGEFPTAPCARKHGLDSSNEIVDLLLIRR